MLIFWLRKYHLIYPGVLLASINNMTDKFNSTFIYRVAAVIFRWAERSEPVVGGFCLGVVETV